MEKTGEHKNLSYAKSLVKFAKDKRNELIEKEIFNAETDVIIVIFDLDIFNAKVKDIDEIFKEEEDHLIFGFTNPEFKLFLLPHILNPFKEYIFFHEYYECFKWIYTYYSSFELPTLQSTEYIISLKNIINSNLYEVMMDLVFKKLQLTAISVRL